MPGPALGHAPWPRPRLWNQAEQQEAGGEAASLRNDGDSWRHQQMFTPG